MIALIDGLIALLKMNFHRLLSRSRIFGPTNTQPILSIALDFCPIGALIVTLLASVTKIRKDVYTKRMII